MQHLLNNKPIPMALACAVAAGVVFAASPVLAAEQEKGYVVNPYGEVVKTGYGECWRSRFPPEEDQSEYAEECGDAADGDQKTAEADSDGDGVVDSRDECPGTGAGRPVNSSGCVLDSDGDGVADDRDRCMGTPAGTEVDQGGCAVDTTIVTTIMGDEFAFDSAELPADLKSHLTEFVQRIRATPGTEQLTIVGHTDSIGPADYNRELSQERAQSVADFLFERGIDRFMMDVSGMGESDPIASNDTAEGRADNRRVEIMSD